MDQKTGASLIKLSIMKMMTQIYKVANKCKEHIEKKERLSALSEIY